MKRRHIAAWIALAACLALSRAPAADDFKGTITYLKGMVRLQSRGTATATPLALGSRLGEGDTITTLAGSRMELTLDSGQIIRAGDHTTLVLRTLSRQTSGGIRARVQAVTGRMWFTLIGLASGSDFQVETPTTVIGIRGTVFRTEIAEAARTDVLVYDGVVTTQSAGAAEVQVEAGKRAVAAQAKRIEVASFDTAQDERDEWVSWNKNRDRLRVSVVIRELHNEKIRTASVAETAIIKGLLRNYLFKVLDKNQADRIRATEAYRAALRGDNAAAASAGLSVAADLIIVGEANVTSFKTPLPGGPYSAQVNINARAVRSDTAEVVAAWAPEEPTAGFELTADAAAHKGLVLAGDAAASAFLESILAARQAGVKRGEALDILVDGVDFSSLGRITPVLKSLAGVKDVKRLYLVGRRALLSVTFAGDSSALADEISTAAFGSLKVSVVGLTAYRLELEAR